MEQTALQRRIRVAAYCRTAVNSDDQINGVAAQKAYYTQRINENPDWEMVGIFVDVGITCVNRKRRVELNRLISACKRGEVDMIITKSVSRFARDISDCVGLIQEFKTASVGVIFEREGINTLSESDDIRLAILGALARIERENIIPNLIYPARRIDKFHIMSMAVNVIQERSRNGTNYVATPGADHPRYQAAPHRRSPQKRQAAGGRLLPGVH